MIASVPPRRSGRPPGQSARCARRPLEMAGDTVRAATTGGVQDMHCEARALKECVLPSGGRGVSAGLTATSIEQDRVIIKVGRQSDKTCQCSPKRPPFLPSLCPSKVAFRLGTSILRGVRFNHPGVTIHSA